MRATTHQRESVCVPGNSDCCQLKQHACASWSPPGVDPRAAPLSILHWMLDSVWWLRQRRCHWSLARRPGGGNACGPHQLNSHWWVVRSKRLTSLGNPPGHVGTTCFPVDCSSPRAWNPSVGNPTRPAWTGLRSVCQIRRQLTPAWLPYCTAHDWCASVLSWGSYGVMSVNHLWSHHLPC